jgi:hypothetical protein
MDQHIPDHAALNAQAASVHSWTNALPLQVMKLFKIPDGLSPAWQTFFDRVAAYHKRQSATTKHALIVLENRSRVMREGGCVNSRC